jgi:hypothetical protein
LECGGVRLPTLHIDALKKRPQLLKLLTEFSKVAESMLNIQIQLHFCVRAMHNLKAELERLNPFTMPSKRVKHIAVYLAKEV